MSALFGLVEGKWPVTPDDMPEYPKRTPDIGANSLSAKAGFMSV